MIYTYLHNDSVAQISCNSFIIIRFQRFANWAELYTITRIIIEKKNDNYNIDNNHNNHNIHSTRNKTEIIANGRYHCITTVVYITTTIIIHGCKRRISYQTSVHVSLQQCGAERVREIRLLIVRALGSAEASTPWLRREPRRST